VTPAAARAEFPLLSTSVYLNSNSTGAFPRGGRVAAEQYYDVVARWRDDAWEGFLTAMGAHADDLAALIGAPASSITLDTSVSSLLGRLLSCFDFRNRSRVVTTDLEFPNVELLLGAFLRYGCEPVVVPSTDGITIDASAVAAAIDERTKLVVVSHATFATGALTDLAPIVRRARSMGALVAVDAYQSLGVVPFDVNALDVDVVFGGAHKWLCGAIDSAFCYVRPSLIGSLVPAATGWMAARDPLSFARAKGFANDARRLSCGTPAPLAALTSREGLRIVRAVGVERVRELSVSRTERIIARADAAGIDVATPREAHARGGVVNLRFARGAEVVASLARDGFVCSHRHGARIAPHFYNTDEEIERFMDALVACVHEARS
jgi:selenocysteine lyase/cysteine desulfurase